MSTYQVLKWDDGVLTLLDQRLIPHELVYLHYEDAAGVASAIRDMVIRGAPAIGVAAAYGLALAAWHSKSDDPAYFLDEMSAAGQVLCASRPTAVNLTWAVERVLNHLERLAGVSVERLRSAALQEAQAIAH